MANICIVDDSAAIRLAASKLVEAAGHEAFVAEDPMEAFRVLAKNSIDIIVSDIEMPNMDGETFCRIVKASQSYGHIPIIFLTSVSGTVARARTKLFGANDHLSKPFSAGDLSSAIEKQLA